MLKYTEKEIGCGTKKKQADFVLLILAGLTGGSGEGYVLDLVNSANDIGTVHDTTFSIPYYLLFICFLMVSIDLTVVIITIVIIILTMVIRLLSSKYISLHFNSFHFN